LLRDYAEKQKLSVEREFEEVESAKAAGRSEFEKMLDYLAQHPDVEHILVEKTDRLTRNFRDMVKIEDTGRTVHFVKEGQIIGTDARQSDKLMYSIKVAIAKSYIDLLSEETRKGMMEKAQQGLYPSWAPLGYVNNAQTKGIDIDFTRAGIIRQLFDAYATGFVSLLELTRMAREKGLRSRKGNQVFAFQIDNMLKNPVYVGDFVWKGVRYKGTHDAIITRSVFNTVQKVRASRRWARKTAREFTWRGFVRCGHCGGFLTPFEKKGKYVYYRCTKTRGKCPEKPIREERLAELLGEPLKAVTLTRERAEWLIKGMSGLLAEEKLYRARERKKLEGEIEEIERRISTLYDDKAAGVVDAAFWKSKYEKYWEEQGRLKEQLAATEAESLEYMEDANVLLEAMQHIYPLYVAAEGRDKRQLLEMAVWNPILRDGKLEYELTKSFEVLVHGMEEEERLLAANAPLEERNKIWLPKRTSFRSRNSAPPEIWFRILHIAPDGNNIFTEADLIEQTVEIALGSKEAFENGNVGTFKRRVTADRIVNAAAKARWSAKPPRTARTPRVVELLRKAIEWQALLESGEVANQAAIARREGITRARVTQVMGLLRLAPEILQHILALPETIGRPTISERALRSITTFDDERQQLQAFADILYR